MDYQSQTLAGMNPVELVVALYDGMVRFLRQAIHAVHSGNEQERRYAIKRVLDILMHLQSRLRMDVGGTSAKALSEFYAAVFALCIEGSRLSSVARLNEAIACICDVREAWSIAARDPEVLRQLRERGDTSVVTVPLPVSAPEPISSRWMA